MERVRGWHSVGGTAALAAGRTQRSVGGGDRGGGDVGASAEDATWAVTA